MSKSGPNLFVRREILYFQYLENLLSVSNLVYRYVSPTKYSVSVNSKVKGHGSNFSEWSGLKTTEPLFARQGPVPLRDVIFSAVPLISAHLEIKLPCNFRDNSTAPWLNDFLLFFFFCYLHPCPYILYFNLLKLTQSAKEKRDEE